MQSLLQGRALFFVIHIGQAPDELSAPWHRQTHPVRPGKDKIRNLYLIANWHKNE